MTDSGSDKNDTAVEVLNLDRLRLECGTVLTNVPIAYQTWGELNTAGDNAIVVCHALTGSADVVAWWPGIVGPGCALDTRRFFVVCCNTLGSPYGSASPLTVNPSTGLPFAGRFPAVTIRDTVAAHRQVLERLGVRSVVTAIGASMGGMQVLEWAFHGDMIRSVIPVAVGGRHSAWCVAWSEAQRQAIRTDPRWNDGHYSPDAPPAAGLATARMIAMISYRSQQEFAARFGRARMEADSDPDGQPPFSAESYLRHQGNKLVSRFDANCYVQLTLQMDTHDVARGRGSYPEVLQTIAQPTLVVGITTDVLYPLEEQRQLADAIPRAQLHVLDAPYGHDSFLIETEHMANLIADWVDQHASRENGREGGQRTDPSVSPSHKRRRAARIDREQPA